MTTRPADIPAHEKALPTARTSADLMARDLPDALAFLRRVGAEDLIEMVCGVTA